eukprot:jgi/Tetstr1/462937/TSEL_007885.t1
MVHVLHVKRPEAKQASAMLFDPKNLIPCKVMRHHDVGIWGYVPGVVANPSCLCQPVAMLISKKYEDNAPELAMKAQPPIYKATTRALNDKNVAAIMHKIRIDVEANPGAKAKPDPKPGAPAVKPKPKPKADRKPAAPKATANSKVAPEPPKAKAKSKVAPEPPKTKAKNKVAPRHPSKGGGQRNPPRGVRDYHKSLEKEAAAKEAEAGTAMDTLE